jgi:hypothetical protein
MITIRISLSWIDPPPHPNLRAGVHHIAEIMPHVLDRHSSSPEQEPDSVLRANATDATDLFDVTLSCLKSALAG